MYLKGTASYLKESTSSLFAPVSELLGGRGYLFAPVSELLGATSSLFAPVSELLGGRGYLLGGRGYLRGSRTDLFVGNWTLNKKPRRVASGVVAIIRLLLLFLRVGLQNARSILHRPFLLPAHSFWPLLSGNCIKPKWPRMIHFRTATRYRRAYP